MKRWSTIRINSEGNFIFNFIIGFTFYLFCSADAIAQELDVAYVPTPDFMVERMLDMADVGPGDYLIDLGCGDGRIVIAAAKRGAIGHGVDLDSMLITEARKNAAKAGVANKVVFFEQNIFETDFSKANVIAMYLFPSINIKLRPSFLENLEPGSRIVSHDFGMDEWKPDQQIGRMENHAALLWIVPAKVDGNWIINIGNDKYRMTVRQEFQEIDIKLMSEETSFQVQNSLLSGKRISFTANEKSGQQKFVFSGQVEQEKISGIVQIREGEKSIVKNWSAKKMKLTE